MSNPFVFYQEEGLLRRINLNEILYLEAKGNYVSFYALLYSEMVRVTLDTALKRMPPGLFIQIHRSFAVAIELLKTVGRDAVTLEGAPDDYEIPVSRFYYPRLLEALKNVPVINAGNNSK